MRFKVGIEIDSYINDDLTEYEKDEGDDYRQILATIKSQNMRKRTINSAITYDTYVLVIRSHENGIGIERIACEDDYDAIQELLVPECGGHCWASKELGREAISDFCVEITETAPSEMIEWLEAGPPDATKH